MSRRCTSIVSILAQSTGPSGAAASCATATVVATATASVPANLIVCDIGTLPASGPSGHRRFSIVSRPLCRFNTKECQAARQADQRCRGPLRAWRAHRRGSETSPSASRAGRTDLRELRQRLSRAGAGAARAKACCEKGDSQPFREASSTCVFGAFSRCRGEPAGRFGPRDELQSREQASFSRSRSIRRRGLTMVRTGKALPFQSKEVVSPVASANCKNASGVISGRT